MLHLLDISKTLSGRFGDFLVFLLRGGARGVRGARKEGRSISSSTNSKSHEGGGVVPGEGAGGRGAGRVIAGNFLDMGG